ncbi:MAG: hypothetical protein V1754_14115 [Pseudomonadota bacterium]
MRLRLIVVGMCFFACITASHARTLVSVELPVYGNAEKAALQFVKSKAEDFGARLGNVDLRVARKTALKDGVVFHIEQYFDGMHILDSGVSVLVMGAEIVAASGQLQSVVKTENRKLIDQRTAEATVYATISNARVRKAKLAVWATQPTATFVWVLDVARSTPLGMWQIRVDAHTGHMLWGIPTIRHSKGKVYLPNPTVSKVTEVELQGLKESLLPDEGLVGEHAAVSSCNASSSALNCEKLAAADTDGNFLYDPKEPSMTDPFSEVQAYYHVDMFHRWLKQNFGFNRNRPTQKIDVIVNLSWETSEGDLRGVYNAFFGDMNDDGFGDLVFGQGEKDFAYDGDVIYHEFTHSVVEETSKLEVNLDKLGLNMMPLSLNEGFADLLSCAYAGDPIVGDYVDNGGIRSLTNISSCPDGLIGESHEDGMIWGSANWSARSQVANTEVFDDILYATMVTIGSNASFAEAATLLHGIAKKNDPAIAKIIDTVFSAQGLFTCERIVPLSPGTTRFGYLEGLDSIPGNLAPASVQYKVEVPKYATEMRFDIAPPADLMYNKWGKRMAENMGAYVKKDIPVEFQGISAIYDEVMPEIDTSITLSVDDPEKPLTPGATYYVIPVNIHTRMAMYEISVTFTEKIPPSLDAGSSPEDAGTPDNDDASQKSSADSSVVLAPRNTGCGCSTPGNQNNWPFSAVPFLLLVLVLRQNRSSRQ